MARRTVSRALLERLLGGILADDLLGALLHVCPLGRLDDPAGLLAGLASRFLGLVHFGRGEARHVLGVQQADGARNDDGLAAVLLQRRLTDDRALEVKALWLPDSGVNDGPFQRAPGTRNVDAAVPVEPESVNDDLPNSPDLAGPIHGEVDMLTRDVGHHLPGGRVSDHRRGR